MVLDVMSVEQLMDIFGVCYKLQSLGVYCITGKELFSFSVFLTIEDVKHKEHEKL